MLVNTHCSLLQLLSALTENTRDEKKRHFLSRNIQLQEQRASNSQLRREHSSKTRPESSVLRTLLVSVRQVSTNTSMTSLPTTNSASPALLKPLDDGPSGQVDLLTAFARNRGRGWNRWSRVFDKDHSMKGCEMNNGVSRSIHLTPIVKIEKAERP